MSPTTRPRLLLVGMGLMGRPYLQRAHERGFAVSVADFEGSLTAPDIADRWQPGDRRYPLPPALGPTDEGWYAAASRAVADERPDAVVGFAEPHIITAALIAAELGLPGPGLHAAAVSRNKAKQRALFSRHGLRQPAYLAGADPAAVEHWAAGRYPVVLKPLAESGSRDVRVAGGVAEVREWVRGRTPGEPFLCEEYVPGPEYSCELLVDRGAVVFANVTAKTTTAPPYCVELSHLVPAEIGEDARDAVVDQAAQVVAALRMGAGVAHVEMRRTDDGPCLMEVAVRTPGDNLMDLIEAATGVDLYDGVIMTAAGRAPAVTPTRARSAAVWYPILQPGAPVPADLLHSAAGLPGVTRVDISPMAPPTVPELRWSLDRLACILLAEDDPETVRASLAHAKKTLALD